MPVACGLTAMIWFDRHLHDVVEEQTAEPERIALKQRTRQIFLTYNLWEETIGVCGNSTGQTPQGRRDGSH
jgi:hypothetical protein